MPGQYNLDMVQGATFERTFQWLIDGVAQNLTGYTFKSECRASESTTAALLLTLSDYMTLSGTDSIVLRIPANVTATLSPTAFRKAHYDLFLIDTDDPTTAFPLVEGNVTLEPATTQTVVVTP